MTATAEARRMTLPTTISRHKKRLSRLTSNRRKPLYQAVFAAPATRRRARTAVWNCINFGKNIDPACGSGNFLTETYISLRRLENEVIRGLIDGQKGMSEGQIAFGVEGEQNPIKMSIGQFYGIEINDFAVSVAKTALWIAES